MLTLAPPLAGAAFLLHVEMWFASHTDYAVLISEPADGPPVITVSRAVLCR